MIISDKYQAIPGYSGIKKYFFTPMIVSTLFLKAGAGCYARPGRNSVKVDPPRYAPPVLCLKKEARY